jgi:hypothetical protein
MSVKDLPAASTVIEHIPDPETCKAMLTRSLRDAELLRRLLKVAQRKADYREREVGKEVAHAG